MEDKAEAEQATRRGGVCVCYFGYFGRGNVLSQRRKWGKGRVVMQDTIVYENVIMKPIY